MADEASQAGNSHCAMIPLLRRMPVGKLWQLNMKCLVWASLGCARHDAGNNARRVAVIVTIMWDTSPLQACLHKIFEGFEG